MPGYGRLEIEPPANRKLPQPAESYHQSWSAQSAPLPAQSNVPVIINGIDASYTVVEGEWGLGQGNQVQPTIYGGRYIDPVPNVGHYYPSAGRMPGYGRLEIEPSANRRLPQPAESYRQSWSAQSAPLPAQSSVPVDPPAIIYAPQVDRRRPPYFPR
jgi:hypothetical protein